MTLWSRTAVRRSLAAAVATGISGFGGLLAFSIAIRSSTRDLPGLWTYRSATWGDGLLLPVSCGALVLARMSLPAGERDRLLTTAAASVGALGGAATQVLWLLDDAPRLNWTLPRPHHFNAAGVYHAIYLTVMSAAFAALWVSVIARALEAAPRSVDWSSIGPVVGVALVSGGGFAVLVLLDNQVSAGTNASLVTTVAVSAPAVGVLLSAAVAFFWKRRQKRALRR